MSAKCDLCGCPDYEVIWDKTEREKQGKLRSVVIRKVVLPAGDGITDDTEAIQGKPSIIQGRNVMCKRCGLVYVWPRMSKEELDLFYAEDYRKMYGGENSLEAEVRHAETAMEIIGRALPNFDDNDHKIYYNNFLDIGCSTGELVSFMRTNLGQGNAYGIEPNEEHYKIAKSKGLKVKKCSIESYSPDFKFDIITMLNALEHVISPTEVMWKIHSLLNDGGHVLICVPNLYNRTIHLPVDAFLSNAHLYNFSIETLTKLFDKCGFNVVKAMRATEEMGDKIYLLGRKVNQRKEPIFTITPEQIELTKKHLEASDWVYGWKEKITQMGFK